MAYITDAWVRWLLQRADFYTQPLNWTALITNPSLLTADLHDLEVLVELKQCYVLDYCGSKSCLKSDIISESAKFKFEKAFLTVFLKNNNAQVMGAMG